MSDYLTEYQERLAAINAWIECADHLDKLAALADGPNAAVISMALTPAALTFRMRAARELERSDAIDKGDKAQTGGSIVKIEAWAVERGDCIKFGGLTLVVQRNENIGSFASPFMRLHFANGFLNINGTARVKVQRIQP